ASRSLWPLRARQAGRGVVEPAPRRLCQSFLRSRLYPSDPFGPEVRSQGMSLLVKICGLSTRETLDAALDAGADMVGFVFFPPSPRHLGFEIARALGSR